MPSNTPPRPVVDPGYVKVFDAHVGRELIVRVTMIARSAGTVSWSSEMRVMEPLVAELFRVAREALGYPEGDL